MQAIPDGLAWARDGLGPRGYTTRCSACPGMRRSLLLREGKAYRVLAATKEEADAMREVQAAWRGPPRPSLARFHRDAAAGSPGRDPLGELLEGAVTWRTTW